MNSSPPGHDPDKAEDLGQQGSMLTTSDQSVLASSAWMPPSPMWLEGAPGEEGIDFSTFLHCLRRRWLSGLLTGAVLAAVVGTVLWVFIPVSFEAVSLVRVRRTEPELLQKRKSTDQEYVTYKQTQATLVTSPFVLNAALRKPGIEQLRMISREAPNQLPWLAGELSVSYPGDSEIMRVGLRGDRKDDATQIVQAVVEAYMSEIVLSEKSDKSRRRDTLQAQQRTNDALIKEKLDQINTLGEQIGASDHDMARVRQLVEHDVLRTISHKQTEVQAQLERLQLELVALQAAQQAAKSFKPNEQDIEIALNQDPQYYAAMENIRLLQQYAESSGSRIPAQIRQQMILAQRGLQRLREEKMPMILRVLQVQSGLDENIAGAASVTIRSQMAMHQARLAALQREYSDQLEKIEQMHGFSSELEVRKAELAWLHDANRTVSAEASRLAVELKGDPRISLMQPAMIPDEGSFVLKLIEVVGGSIVTMGLTLLGFTLWDYKDKRLNSGKELEGNCRLPVIGTVPALRSKVGSLLGSRGTSEAAVADSVDSIRSAIMYGRNGKQIRSVLVTSAVGHEGKSTVASQLAVSLARADRRTLLIDADVRNPQQHAVFGLPPDRGFCDVLRGQVELEEVVQATPAEGLWILPSGRCDATTLQMIAGQGFSATIERLSAQFDFIILDSGPVLTGPEAMIYGQHVDAAVISTRRDVSRLPKIDEAYRRLQSVGVDVLGAVVNGTSSEVRRHQLAMAGVPQS
jgi:succinoglycan biosynthesis transport protein ExoP